MHTTGTVGLRPSDSAVGAPQIEVQMPSCTLWPGWMKISPMAPRRSNAPTAAGIEKPSVRTILPRTGSSAPPPRAASGRSNRLAVPPAYFDGT